MHVEEPTSRSLHYHHLQCDSPSVGIDVALKLAEFKSGSELKTAHLLTTCAFLKVYNKLFIQNGTPPPP